MSPRADPALCALEWLPVSDIGETGRFRDDTRAREIAIWLGRRSGRIFVPLYAALRGR